VSASDGGALAGNLVQWTADLPAGQSVTPHGGVPGRRAAPGGRHPHREQRHRRRPGRRHAPRGLRHVAVRADAGRGGAGR
jgi:hypothetical protein